MKCPGDPLAIIQAWEAGSSIRFVGVQNQRTLTELEVSEVDPTTTLWYNMTLDLYGFSKVHVITASLDGSTFGWHVLLSSWMWMASYTLAPTRRTNVRRCGSNILK